MGNIINNNDDIAEVDNIDDVDNNNHNKFNVVGTKS